MQQTLNELLLPPNCASSSVVGYQALRSGEHVYCDGGWIVSVSALNYLGWFAPILKGSGAFTFFWYCVLGCNSNMKCYRGYTKSSTELVVRILLIHFIM